MTLFLLPKQKERIDKRTHEDHYTYAHSDFRITSIYYSNRKQEISNENGLNSQLRHTTFSAAKLLVP